MNNIEIKGLTKHYGDFTLGPIDMNIPKGAIVGYIGENGSGKSTTIKAILGLIKPDAGSIKVFGKDISELDNEDKNAIGVVLDKLTMPGMMKLEEVEKFCSMLYSNWDSSKFESLSRSLDLTKNRKISELSKGNSMKLAIIIALCHNAKLLILDEPTSGLDPVVRMEVTDMLMDFIQEEERSVFISSHITSDLERVTDYIAFLHDGKLMFMESENDLTQKYGMCSVSAQSIHEIDTRAIIGKREHNFGVELLVYRDLMPKTISLEKARVEDIMWYTIKGGVK